MTFPSLYRLGSIAMFILAGRRQSSMNTDLIQRFMAGCATVLGLAVIAALFTGLLMLVGLYLTYTALVAYGYTASAAMLITCLLVVAIICALVMRIQCNLEELKQLPGEFVQAEMPVTSGISGVTNAFIDGLMGTDTKPSAAVCRR